MFVAGVAACPARLHQFPPLQQGKKAFKILSLSYYKNKYRLKRLSEPALTVSLLAYFHSYRSLRSHHHKRRASIVVATSVYDRRGLDLVGEMRLQWSGAREGVVAEYGGGEDVDPVVLPQRLPPSIQTPDVTARHSRQNESACAARCRNVRTQWSPDYRAVDTLSGLRRYHLTKHRSKLTVT